MSRPNPLPPADTTLHHISDTHFGGVLGGRPTKTMSDIVDGRMMETVVAHIVTGDLVDAHSTANDNAYLAWMAQFPSPVYAAVGNHDVWGGRTFDQAAVALGLPAKDYAVDLPFARLVVIGPDELGVDFTTMTFGSTCLDWLDAELTASAGDPVVVACHAPLYGTVLADPLWPGSATSASTPASCNVDADVRAVLADHANVKVWLSGHTHSAITAPDLVKAETIGGRTVAHINGSAIYYNQGPRTGQSLVRDPLHSLYVTYLGDSVEVRFRNHGAKCWDGPFGQKVLTVDLT